MSHFDPASKHDVWRLEKLVKLALAKLDVVADEIQEGRDAVLEKLDAESDQLSEQLEAIAGELNEPSQAETVEKIRRIAKTLNAMAKPIAPTTPS